MPADDNTISRTDAVIDSLRRLDGLKNDGIITETEFLRLKSELIGRPVRQEEITAVYTPEDKSNIRSFADSLFGSFVPEMKTSGNDKNSSGKYNFTSDAYRSTAVPSKEQVGISSLINNIDISLNNIDPVPLSAEQTAPPSAHRPSEKVSSVQSLIDDIDFSLDGIRSAPQPPHGNLTQPPEIIQDLTEGIDFSLDTPSDISGQNITPVIAEDMTQGIDFSLDGSASSTFRSFDVPPSGSVSLNLHRSFIRRAAEKFLPMKSLYDSRNSALMNMESLGALSIIPIFAVGAAAAVFFYFVLVILADMTYSLENFLLLFCFWAGVAPACVIIPNSVRTIAERKKAADADERLRDYYDSSGYTEIPYELTDPNILEFLEEGSENGSLEELRTSAAALMNALSPEFIEKERKKADRADDDADASRAASMYVLGSRLASRKP